ncbi:MAG TPA: hypothetical protein VKB17_05655 [Thermoleophilaceae bacterium]|nr:hypothetical protein [Thermoleophilaceae bacterium]
MSEPEPFTSAELEVLALAWAAQQEGKAFRPTDDDFTACHGLAERGWLERRWNNQNDDLVFRWSQQAETALDINILTR